jgi:hypothetical protein
VIPTQEFNYEMWRRIIRQKFAYVSEKHTSSIRVYHEVGVLRSSETSVKLYQITRRHIIAVNILHSSRCENLKSQIKQTLLMRIHFRLKCNFIYNYSFI